MLHGRRMKGWYARLTERFLLILRGWRARWPWIGRFIPEEAFEERYWEWERGSVVRGAFWAGFFAPFPLPAVVHGVLGIWICMRNRANIPVMLTSCLLPPGASVIIVPSQWILGWWILHLLGVERSGNSWEDMYLSLKQHEFISFMEKIGWVNGLWELAFGVVLSCILLAFAARLLMDALWFLGGRFSARG